MKGSFFFFLFFLFFIFLVLRYIAKSDFFFTTAYIVSSKKTGKLKTLIFCIPFASKNMYMKYTE